MRAGRADIRDPLHGNYPLLGGVRTARRLVDAAGTATDAYSLDAFGRYMGGWANPTPNPYRFGAAWGYITDTPGSGLLQLGARFYWPEVGRFIQQDPIGDGTNWYAYAENNPLIGVDPEGLWKGGWAFTKCMISMNTGIPRSWVETAGSLVGISKTPGVGKSGGGGAGGPGGTGPGGGPLSGASDPIGWGARALRSAGIAGLAAKPNNLLGGGLRGLARRAPFHLNSPLLRRVNVPLLGRTLRPFAGLLPWVSAGLVVYSGIRCGLE